MKNSTIMKLMTAVVICLFNTAGIFAQTPPASITEGANKYYQHGLNATHTDPASPDAAEATDYVTTGGKTRYYVAPNPVANPSFNIATSLFNNISSSFTWTLSVPANGSIATVPSTYDNYVEITWGSTLGAVNLSVTEKADATHGGCTGPATTIPIKIIAAPTASYNTVSGGYLVAACYADATAAGSASYNFPLTVGGDATNNGQNWQVKYTVAKDGGAAGTEKTADVDVSGGVANAFFTVDNTNGFSGYGSYVVTITSVSDKISRKSGVWKSLTSNNTFTYVIYQVKTGPIYHLPNM